MSTLAKEGTRKHGYIFWPTEHARKLVVAVLKEEPAKRFGLRTPAVYKNIMDRFPNEKLHYHLLAPAVRASLKSGTTLDASHPPHPAHPIRSVHYLKHVVLAKMEKREQIEQIRVVRGRRTRLGTESILFTAWNAESSRQWRQTLWTRRNGDGVLFLGPRSPHFAHRLPPWCSAGGLKLRGKRS
ncbi:hypothetical protein BDZ89DRAFT_555188 [Hymenopellis radicata]|nr:hypothetical protein BDZ89DRAFT_555188 [Hymenopellis radicata]